MKKTCLRIVAALCIITGQLAYAAAPNEEAQAIALCKKSIEIQNRQDVAKGQTAQLEGTADGICPYTGKSLNYWQCVVARQETGETTQYATAACKDK